VHNISLHGAPYNEGSNFQSILQKMGYANHITLLVFVTFTIDAVELHNMFALCEYMIVPTCGHWLIEYSLIESRKETLILSNQYGNNLCLL